MAIVRPLHLVVVAALAVASANVTLSAEDLLDGQELDLTGGVVAPYDPKIIPDRRQSASDEKGTSE